MHSEKHFAAHTTNLSLFGCFVQTATPFSEGTKVRLKISRGGAHVVGLGKVAYAWPGSGMGIQFVTIEPSSLPVLDRWLASAREE